MSVKIFLSDFDGTLVNKDILDVLCGINGKEEESKTLNEEFVAGKREGLPTLKQRIDFLHGISRQQIKDKLDNNNYLLPGAVELFKFLKVNDIITVLHSGNIVPTLEYYQQLLGIDYIIGTSPRMDSDVISGIEITDFESRDFKVNGCKKVIEKLGIAFEEIVAIGDSPADAAVFEIAKTTIAINPKGNIAEKATYVIEDNLINAIDIVKKLI